MKINFFASVLTLSAVCLLAVSTIAAQSKDKSQDKNKKDAKRAEKMTTVREGVGFGGLRVGKSTMADVVKKFGKDYKWTAFKKYSYAMTYPKLGLAFYMCQSDKRKEIFDIEIRAPFQAQTSKGIILGKSTLADIQKLYGKTADGGLQYRGVSFFYANFKGKKTVTVIDIVENSGIRQCDEAPAQKKNK